MSRLLAFVVDQFLIGILVGIGASLVAGAVEVVMNRQLDVSDGRWQVALADEGTGGARARREVPQPGTSTAAPLMRSCHRSSRARSASSKR
jgi:hypothetical protein